MVAVMELVNAVVLLPLRHRHLWGAGSRLLAARAESCCSSQKRGAAVFVDEGPGLRAPDRAFPPRLALERASSRRVPHLPARAAPSRTSVRDRAIETC